jgi:hypothetical protein
LQIFALLHGYFAIFTWAIDNKLRTTVIKNNRDPYVAQEGSGNEHQRIRIRGERHNHNYSADRFYWNQHLSYLQGF